VEGVWSAQPSARGSDGEETKTCRTDDAVTGCINGKAGIIW
jgi:hypothetical protein